MAINLWIHRFMDCGHFPEGASVKVKQKMTTSNLCFVTCPTCKDRVVAAAVAMVSQKNWAGLTPPEIAVLEAALASSKQ